MEEKNTKSKKRLVYYILLAVCALLLIAGVVLTVYFVTQDSKPVVEQPPVDEQDPNDPAGPGEQDPNDPAGPGEQDPNDPANPDDPAGPDDPTGGEGVKFVAPVSYEQFAVEYASIYNNGTTGWWYRHKAVDFAVAAGTEVKCMADGTVEEISMSQELGNLVVIDHGDGLKTIYRFIEPDESLKEGAKVTMGQKLGVVADAYGSEAFAGAHLHLEVMLGEDYVDPTDYLEPVLDEK